VLGLRRIRRLSGSLGRPSRAMTWDKFGEPLGSLSLFGSAAGCSMKPKMAQIQRILLKATTGIEPVWTALQGFRKGGFWLT
jgi:hypothetical protein